MIDELVYDYAAYLKVDLTKELTPIEETIEDMLTRLEEFESLLTMVANHGDRCLNGPIPEILARKAELDTLCGKIDHLEVLVQCVKKDVAAMEAQVETAEADLATEDSSFKNMFKPFFKKTDPLAARTSKTYKAPEIFSTASFFEPQEEVASSSTK